MERTKPYRKNAPPKKGWAHTSPRVGGFPTPPLLRHPVLSMSQKLRKPSGKNMEKEHIVYVSSCCTNCLIKNLNVRNIRKTHIREKEYNSLNIRLSTRSSGSRFTGKGVKNLPLSLASL